VKYRKKRSHKFCFKKNGINKKRIRELNARIKKREERKQKTIDKKNNNLRQQWQKDF
jgi:F0F1-type ATP synthase assembly protein I